MRKNVNLISCLLLSLCTSHSIARNFVEANNINKPSSDMAVEYLMASSLPAVISIGGMTNAPKNIAESYYATLDGSLPSGGYVEWIATPSAACDFYNGNTGGSVLVIFRQDGECLLTARARSASGDVGMSRYIRVMVSN